MKKYFITLDKEEQSYSEFPNNSTKSKYPDWAHDPREDARDCWYAKQDTEKTQNRRVTPSLYRVRL